TDEALVERARAAGIMAYLLKPLRPAELAPALDLAIARFAETRQLKQTLEDRKVIERAKGALMARLGLTEDDAFKRLRRAAMDSRKPMVEVARALLVSESVISRSSTGQWRPRFGWQGRRPHRPNPQQETLCPHTRGEIFSRPAWSPPAPVSPSRTASRRSSARRARSRSRSACCTRCRARWRSAKCRCATSC